VLFESDSGRLFPSASLIKVPLLLAWLEMEKAGTANRNDLCSLDREPAVGGAGISELLQGRSLPYADVLLLMMALSDNLCTNLVIRHIGLERANAIFREQLGLLDTRIQRKMMDFEARQSGRENWISARDCIRLYLIIEELATEDRVWVESLLGACQDGTLLMRSLVDGQVRFYHKTGALPGVLHDWGFTRQRRLFLLTEHSSDEPAVLDVFGQAGILLSKELAPVI
jgi:beta-lactamase class A